jgi:hypothetical protein
MLRKILGNEEERWPPTYTDKKEKKIFLIYKEIQMVSGAKSYSIEEEIPNI